MNICIVSTDYPAPSHPKYVFVEQLVNEMVNQGVDISVIAPQSITRHLLKGDPLLAVDSEKKIGNRSYHIYRPKYLTLGNAPRWIQNILEWLRYKVILRVITKHNLKPDAIYGHFWQNAFDIRKYCYKNGTPLFVACGEGDTELGRTTISSAFDNPYSIHFLLLRLDTLMTPVTALESLFFSAKDNELTRSSNAVSPSPQATNNGVPFL